MVATGVHDPLDARAFSLADGSHTAVVVSVVAQGLFNTYIDRMIARAKALAPIDHMIVSANHNESSPDTIGIYGGPAPPSSPAGLQTGINDYYMDFLVAQVAKVAADAAKSRQPATLRAAQFPLPSNIAVKLSDNWPTTDNSTSKPTAIDPRIGILQARATGGAAIFTVMSLAAHNQEVGHGGTSLLSSDWPGYFHSELESRVGGTAMFLVGANGSEEDPCTTPLPRCEPEPPGTFARAETTGRVLAATVAAQAPLAQPLRAGALRYARRDFCVPIENNLFKAAAAVGLFGERVTYVNAGGTCVPAGVSAGGLGGLGPTATGPPDSLMTTTSLLDVGPDLQLLANPGEAFPALVLGSPWRHADVPSQCSGRANPAVPNWRAHGLFRFQVGLANDLIGYEIPAWSYISDTGAFTTSDPQCQNDTIHHHKLETEGVGPTASNAVADQLTGLVRADAPDPSARVELGRYVLADGSYSHFPAGARGILLARQGAAALDPDSGTLIGSPETAGFGSRAADATGLFMDYNGQPQAAADVTTRGMIVLDPNGCVVARHYLDAFPDLNTSRTLGRAVTQVVVLPDEPCTAPPRAPTPGVQNGPALGAGLQVPEGTPGAPAGRMGSRGCSHRVRPRSHVALRRITVRPGATLRLSGRGFPHGCSRAQGRLARVTVVIFRSAGKGRCRFVNARGRLGPATRCGRPVRLLARGTLRWSLRLRLHVAAGSYTAVTRAVDRSGLMEAYHHGLNSARISVRRPGSRR